MKDGFKRQFGSLNGIINTNLKTLIDLVKQSQDLSEMLASLDDTECSEIKKKLLKTFQEIQKSIDNLVDQTATLFEHYNVLFQQIYGK